MDHTSQSSNSGKVGHVPYGDNSSIVEKIVLSEPVRHDDLRLTRTSHNLIDKMKHLLCNVAPRLGPYNAAIMIQPIIIRRWGITGIQPFLGFATCDPVVDFSQG